MPDPNPRNIRSVREIARQDILFSVARIANSSRIFVASSANKIFELDAGQNTPVPRELADHGRYVNAVRIAGNTAISGGYDNRLIWWDIEGNRAIRTTEDAHARQIRQLAISPDGTKLASVADDMVCRIWNIENGERIRELRGHAERTPTNFGSMLYCCTFSPDGTKIATGDRVGQVIIWELLSGRQLANLDASSLYTWDGVQRIRSIGGVRALEFSPDGTQIAAGGVGQISNVDGLGGPSRVEIFNWARRERTHQFQGQQQGLVNKLIWHPQWLLGLGGGNNGFLFFHDVNARNMIHQANLPMHTHDGVFNEDFSTLYAVGHQKITVHTLV